MILRLDGIRHEAHGLEGMRLDGVLFNGVLLDSTTMIGFDGQNLEFL